MLVGERPFEDWMYVNGYSDEDIAEVYHSVDKYLMDVGILPAPPWNPNLQ